MGINWITGSGVFVAIGWIVAAGFVVQYWWVFVFVGLGLLVLHCLTHEHTQRVGRAADQARIARIRQAEAEMADRIARRH